MGYGGKRGWASKGGRAKGKGSWGKGRSNKGGSKGRYVQRSIGGKKGKGKGGGGYANSWKGKGRKGKGKGRKGKGKGRKGKGKGKVSKDFLDKQLEEYMGPDAMKAVLDQELDTYFAKNGAAATNRSTNGSTTEPITVGA